jgi:uncharacterized MAPEG superfamily protein
MNTDLLALLGVGLVAFVLQYVPGLDLTKKAGLSWGIGNREHPPDPAPWAARAQRAQKNLLENLPHFTIVVLVAQLAHQADDLTATASLVYLGARITHAIVYTAGITVVRTIAFYTGVAAEAAIVYAIFT